MSSQPASGELPQANARARLLIQPGWLVVIAIVSVHIGTATAKQLFDTIGFSGVVFVRTLLASAVFLLFVRPRLRGYSRQVYLYIVLYGMAIAANMLTFYAAIERIPLGITVAIAFAGPLTVSVLGSRRAVDFMWIAVAAGGILLLSPITDVTLDPVGLFIAVICGLMWGIFVVVMKRASSLLPGNSILALSMCVAALIAAPFGAVGAVGVLASPQLLATALVVALLSSVIPFWLEFKAVKYLEPRTFGVLLSLEPAAAALMGWIFLHEDLSIEKIAGIGLVTLAAIGTTRSNKVEDVAALPVIE